MARRGPDHMSRIHRGFVYAGDINQYCGYDVPNKTLVEAGYSNSNIEKFWKSIGILASYCYRNGCALHEASGEEPMCPDEDRDLRFASKVQDKLGIAEPKDMRMEVVIPSCYEILPMPNDFPLDFHFDEGNDRSKGYEKCLCTSVPLVNSTGDKILLFQIILACRKSICQHLNKQKKRDVENLADSLVSILQSPPFSWEERLLRAGKDFCRPTTEPQNAVSFHLQTWDVGGIQNLFCNYVPIGLLQPMAQYYNSLEYQEKWELNKTAIQFYDTQTGNEEKRAHKHA